MRPSWAISIVSIATSFASAFKSGPVNFDTQPLEKCQRRIGVRASSRRTIEPLRRSAVPCSIALRQFHSCASCVTPRLRTMFEYLVSPGSLRTVLVLSLPARYSMTSVSLPSPLTCLNAAIVIPSISTRKLKPVYGSSRDEGAMAVRLRRAGAGSC